MAEGTIHQRPWWKHRRMLKANCASKTGGQHWLRVDVKLLKELGVNGHQLNGGANEWNMYAIQHYSDEIDGLTANQTLCQWSATLYAAGRSTSCFPMAGSFPPGRTSPALCGFEICWKHMSSHLRDM